MVESYSCTVACKPLLEFDSVNTLFEGVAVVVNCSCDTIADTAVVLVSVVPMTVPNVAVLLLFDSDITQESVLNLT